MDLLYDIYNENYFIKNVFALVGFSMVMKGVVNIGKLLYEKYGRKKLNLPVRYGHDSYVLISESADKVGLELAKKFVGMNFNIIQISRSQEKLEEIEKILKEINPRVDIVSIQADFFEAHKKRTFSEIDKKTKDLDISILVNNVTMVDYELFLDQPRDLLYDLVKVNQYTTLFLSQLVSKRFVQRSKRSAIVNISSLAALKHYHQPYCSVYAACQSFQVSLYRNLQQELGGKVDILTCPNLLDTQTLNTKMSKLNGFNKQDNKNLKLHTLVEDPSLFSDGVLKDLGQKNESNATAHHFKISFIFEGLKMFGYRENMLYEINRKMLGFVKHQRKLKELKQEELLKKKQRENKNNSNKKQDDNEDEDEDLQEHPLNQDEFVPIQDEEEESQRLLEKKKQEEKNQKKSKKSVKFSDDEGSKKKKDDKKDKKNSSENEEKEEEEEKKKGSFGMKKGFLQ